ncbi:LacI family transcriptional regulator [Halolactibacillus alkaliphilus]|uniref:LacI family transcriptional regulator n=1 Tax=Halolactibacillus alkaliphilus TaxID=442899 RepID=A0A511X089_9BACI|nr:LacI family DNA-binding transcriptional regulator [Halolactibacillus alkaliphilus]GEN56363.1 LacI family transcriptional regulator [Halolactibacillus alkaliphilus]GGN67515.1 LacI family transcriptional regulator [Halolactibacillus alkaliphilus]SFO91788.1 transcriptional regulator, LacI family [Halolactibacillus alkaliphilus]
MTNIKDLAKRAGVSVTTVSRVLNHHPYVSDAKRIKVERAIEETGYSQNMNAVHLSKGKTNVIGVILPFLDHPYFAQVLIGISDKAQAKGQTLMLFPTNYEQEKEQEALLMLRQKQLDGVIVCSRVTPLHVLEAYVQYGPIVLLEQRHSDKFSTVFVDHQGIFNRALEYLYQKGHRNIGYTIYRRHGTHAKVREETYHAFLARHDLPFNQDYCFEGALYLEDSMDVLRKLMKLKTSPTALLVTSDQVAAGLFIHAKAFGLTIPEDVAIIGLNDEPIAKALKLTTVHIPLKSMGEALLDQVLSTHKENIQFDITLIERQTV